MGKKMHGNGGRIRFSKDLVAFAIVLLGVAVYFCLEWILNAI